MTERDYIYWLRGYLDNVLYPENGLSELQVEIIKKKMDSIFQAAISWNGTFPTQQSTDIVNCGRSGHSANGVY